MTTIKVITLDQTLKGISYSRPGDAGLDLRASGVWVTNLDAEPREVRQDAYDIQPRERILIKTGIKMALPPGYYGSIRDRSGLALKHGLHTLSGVLDETYRDEIGVVMVNLGTKPYRLLKNDRIAQIIIMPYATVTIEHVDALDTTVRDGGFGSSGRR